MAHIWVSLDKDEGFLNPSRASSSQARFRLLSRSRNITLRNSEFSRD